MHRLQSAGPRPIAARFLGALSLLVVTTAVTTAVVAEPTRLLRQPTLGSEHLVFAHGADLWIVGRDGGDAHRLTSTPAVESDPHLSPDGRHVAFSSNRSGVTAVYVVSVDGGEPRRLTWYPATARVLGWSPDGSRILYASGRGTAPVAHDRLWTVSPDGGPSELLPAPWGHDAAWAPGGDRLIVDRVSRWDSEWRAYRGGQNTPLVLLDLDSLEETWLPNERTTDVEPVWFGDEIFFLSDRDWTMNIWSYAPDTGEVRQRTRFEGADIKSLSAGPDRLVYEREGLLHLFDPASDDSRTLDITVRGDFPWAETEWVEVTDAVRSVSLSATGKRALMEARGEVFTVPAEKGDSRNLTRSSDAADRNPVWSPRGDRIAWFSDRGGRGYALFLADQDGLGEPRRIDIGESKMAWEPAWSPDAKRIAFTDDDVRVRVVEVESGEVSTVAIGGNNLERGRLGLTWSPDSRWLAFASSDRNQFRRVRVWSVDDGTIHTLTDPLADAFSPAWDLGGRYLAFLASTDVALGSGWANTSSMGAEPEYGGYLIVLRGDDPSPFPPESDEEPADEGSNEDDAEGDADDEGGEEGGDGATDGDAEDGGDATDDDDGDDATDDDTEVRIDLDPEVLSRQTVALPVPVGRHVQLAAGPAGTFFLAERAPGSPGTTLHKFSIEKREAESFATGVRQFALSADGSSILLRSAAGWQVADTGGKSADGGKKLSLDLRVRLDRGAEWRQIFEEALRYERDYFYDPGLHGRDWDAVRARYEPLLPWVRHRADLTYLLDQISGELSVGHSFVFGGDYPETPESRMGVLGADLEAVDGRWRIARILTSESWNPDLRAPLARPGLDVSEGDYLLAVNGVELTAADDPFRLLDGTAGRQTVLHVSGTPDLDDAREVIVEPADSETGLRRRAWVEDNRRRVDELSDGRVAYIWVPNTGGPGVVSFNRYFFAQQDRSAAVIDERFNGGGLLDDYMVDLMTRRPRAALTNEVPEGEPLVLPAGILGPKVLLINEMAGSGGDFFPWVFRQQQAGPLVGMRTWGGLVKSSVHYALVDGGAMTAPDNAVFDPVAGEWIGENEGIPPDIEVRPSARAVAEGRDLQLERAVEEALRLLEENPPPPVRIPEFPRPALPPR